MLCEDRNGRNTLQYLMFTKKVNKGRDYDIRGDNVIVTQMNRLKQIALLKKKDIPRYNLVHIMFHPQRYISSRKLRFLIQWDPTVLLQTCEENGRLPLHHTVHRVGTIESFEFVFDFTILYYPIMKGIHFLFQKNNDGDTPLQLACQKYGRDRVMNGVDEVLARYVIDTPLNNIKALLVAAIDDNIHFDCVYFLIRREPDLVLRLLQPGFRNDNNYDDDNDDSDDDDDDNDNGNDDDNDNADRNAGYKVNAYNDDDDGGDVGDNINHNTNFDDNNDDDDDDNGTENYIGPCNNIDVFNHDNGGNIKNGLSSIDANNTDINDKKRKRGS